MSRTHLRGVMKVKDLDAAQELPYLKELVFALDQKALFVPGAELYGPSVRVLRNRADHLLLRKNQGVGGRRRQPKEVASIPGLEFKP